MRLHSSHGETGHCTELLLGLGPVVGVDIGHELVYEHGLEVRYVELPDTAHPGLVGHTVGHDDDERLYAALGYHVVHDEAGLALD